MILRPDEDVRERRERRLDGRRLESIRATHRHLLREELRTSVLGPVQVAAKTTTSTAKTVPESDSLALVALYQSTDGGAWKESEGWLEANVSEWAGVTVEDGRVTRITLEDNGLSGPLPPELGDLDALQALELYNNHLTGELGSELAGLSTLVVMDLGANDLSGPIPSEIGGLDTIVHLVLDHNRFTGTIPSDLGRLDQLEALTLEGNDLEGSIPSELGGLGELRVLNLSRNGLTGSIPVEIGSLASLSVFEVRDNDLSGEIPAELGGMSGLEELSLSGNQLEGSIPTEITELTNLRRLDLASNQIEGKLPESIGNLSSLEELSLEQNQLSGAIPASLGQLSALTRLDLAENDLTGSIPSSLGDLTELVEFELAENELIGSIPSSLGQLDRVEDFSLGRNALTGSIPPELGGMAEVRWLDLRENDLDGAIPAELTGLAHLRSINVFGNALSGALPEIESWQTLRYFYAGANDLTGAIPSGFGRATELQELWLPANRLEGGLPADLEDLQGLRVLALGGNQLTGSFPSAIAQLTRLQKLYLTANDLEGTVPASIGELPDLRQLRLGGNRFTGALPASIADLSNLRRLDLDHNRFDQLPDLSALGVLQALRVQANELTFEDLVPNSGVAAREFIYAPQGAVGEESTQSTSVGEPTELSFELSHADNEYQWYHDESPVSGATTATYEIQATSTDDEGVYSLEVNNANLPDLTLTSANIQLTVTDSDGGDDSGDGGGSGGDSGGSDGGDDSGDDGGSGGDSGGSDGGDDSGDGGGSSGDSGGQIEAPVVNAPKNTAPVDIPVQLRWTVLEEASSYHVQVATSSAFDAPVFDDTQIEKARQLVGELEPSSDYVWRVRGVSGDVEGEWSPTYSFTTADSASAFPSSPSLDRPEDGGADVDTSLTLAWKTVEAATGYEVAVTSDSSFEEVYISDTAGESTYEVAGLEHETVYYWRVRTYTSVDTSGWSSVRSFETSSRTVTATDARTELPDEFTLEANYPNPFNPGTTIEYAVPRSAAVRLEVFDALGRRVETLVNRDVQPPGRYTVRWEADGFPSGLYFYRLTTPHFQTVRRMTLAK